MVKGANPSEYQHTYIHRQIAVSVTRKNVPYLRKSSFSVPFVWNTMPTFFLSPSGKRYFPKMDSYPLPDRTPVVFQAPHTFLTLHKHYVQSSVPSKTTMSGCQGNFPAVLCNFEKNCFFCCCLTFRRYTHGNLYLSFQWNDMLPNPEKILSATS